MKNVRNEYAEELEKDTANREEYHLGIVDFLHKQQERAQQEREKIFTPENYKENPEYYREKLINMLGFPLMEKREKPQLLEKIFVACDKNVNIYRMRLSIFGIPFYALYFEQTVDKNKKPFVVCLHGGSGTPELISGIHADSANYNHIARRLTDYGANVFVPQLLLWNVNEYGNEYDRLKIDGKIRQLGGSITALELSLLRSSLDYFIQEENINADKIGVVGLSYGGMYALHFAAIDVRVKACFSCSWVCNGFQHSWADWSYLNAQNICSTVETGACVSPRALVVAMGDKDELFDFRQTLKTCDQIREFYKAFGKDDSFKVNIFNGNHEMVKENDNLEFFFQKL